MAEDYLLGLNNALLYAPQQPHEIDNQTWFMRIVTTFLNIICINNRRTYT